MHSVTTPGNDAACAPVSDEPWCEDEPSPGFEVEQAMKPVRRF